MTKKTRLIGQGQLDALLRTLVAECGYPTYAEELVLFLTPDRRVKVSLTRERFTISWRPAAETPDAYQSRKRGFLIGRSDLKEKLIFLAESFGTEAVLSITPVSPLTLRTSGSPAFPFFITCVSP